MVTISLAGSRGVFVHGSNAKTQLLTHHDFEVGARGLPPPSIVHDLLPESCLR